MIGRQGVRVICPRSTLRLRVRRSADRRQSINHSGRVSQAELEVVFFHRVEVVRARGAVFRAYDGTFR